MASSDGIRFLQEDEFLGQLVKSFAQLDPVGLFRCFVAHTPTKEYSDDANTGPGSDFLQEKGAGDTHLGLLRDVRHYEQAEGGH